MSGIQPVAVYTLRIPPGDIPVPAVPEAATMFRLTMAAIDPSAEPELEDTEDKRPPRATLKLVRFPDNQFDDSDDSDFDEDEEDSDEDGDSDEEENGGPSDKKSKKQKLLEALIADDEDDDEDMEEADSEAEELAAKELIKKLTQSSKAKGKAKAVDGEDDDEDEDDESDESVEVEEVVICTLDPEKHYQQPLDIVVGEGERVFFSVSGTHEIHLTGNYVIPADDGRASLYDEEDEEEEDYDLSPDEDELDAIMDEDEESDELDDMDDPRITELASDEEIPKLIAIAAKGKAKGKNKRPADDSDEDLDALVAKSIQKEEPVVNGDSKKMTKAEKKAAKKLKKNDGEAAPAAASEKKPEAAANGSEKKTVQFAKNLEQGPTPSATPPAKKEEVKKEEVKKAGANNATPGVRTVNGVTVDDRKTGSGPAAKKNSKVEMRYIGKLENGKVFDSNKSGKPFGFKLGTGEVIKGCDIGLEGISAGGERRITIPAHLAYGKKALPGIPANSKLIFDVKCLSVK